MLPSDVQPRVKPLYCILLALGYTWIVTVGILYIRLIGYDKWATISQHFKSAYLSQFYAWQLAGFALLALCLGFIRLPRWLTLWPIVYLGISTAVFLGWARDAHRTLQIVEFAAWILAALQTMRLAIRRWVDPRFDGWGIAIASFFGFWMLASFLLGLVKLLYLPIIIAIAAVLVYPGVRSALRSWRNLGRPLLDRLGEINPLGWISLEVIWFISTLSFTWASMPEVGSDSTRVYLPVIRQIATHHGMVPEYIDLARLLPKAMQAGLVPAFLVGDFLLAKWFSWFAIIGLVLLVVEELTYRTKRPNLALFGGAAVIACPLLLELSVYVYMDLFITLLACAGILALLRALQVDSRRGACLAGAIMASAGTIKYNAVIFCVVWGVVLVVGGLLKYRFKRGLAFVWLPILTACLVGLPWFIYTYAVTGNPLFPFMNDFFGSPYWKKGADTSGDLKLYSIVKRPVDWLLFPWNATFLSTRLGVPANGYLGFWILALFPFIVLNIRDLAKSGVALVLIGLAMFAGVTVETQYARYWLPAVPLLLIAAVQCMGQLLTRSNWNPKRWILAPVVPFVGIFLLASMPLSAIPFTAGWQIHSRARTREHFLGASYSYAYRLAENMNKWIKPDDEVLVTDYGAMVYLINACAHEFPFHFGGLMDLNDEMSMRRFLDERKIKYWVVNFASSDQQKNFNDKYHFDTDLWADARIVDAGGPCYVFDVSRIPTKSKRVLVGRQRVLPNLQEPMTPIVRNGGWLDTEAKSHPDAMAKQNQDSIQIVNGNILVHAFTIPEEVKISSCRITLDLAGEKAGAHILLTDLYFADEKGNQMASEKGTVTANNTFKSFKGHMSATVPPGAKVGSICLNPWQSLPVTFKGATIELYSE